MSMPPTHEASAVIDPDGSVRIAGVPFGVGKRVHVSVWPDPSDQPRRHSAEEIERSRMIRRSLRLSVREYNDPFGPAVPIGDWDALRDDEP